MSTDDEAAGVASHHHGRQITLSAAADLDHLVGPDEMIFDPRPPLEKAVLAFAMTASK
jgi:hypothetical protein